MLRLAAVTRTRHTADHGVDAVAIALGVFQALQNHYADAFTDSDAVGASLSNVLQWPRVESAVTREKHK